MRTSSDDYKKAEQLKHLIDFIEKPTILCATDKTKQQLIPFILHTNKSFIKLIGTKECIGLNFDFPIIKKNTKSFKQKYDDFLNIIRHHQCEKECFEINNDKNDLLFVKITFSPIHFINDEKEIQYYIFTYEQVDDIKKCECGTNSKQLLNATNYNKLKEILENEQFLSEINKLLESNEKYKSILAKVIEKLRVYLNCDRVLIHDFDEEEDTYTFILEDVKKGNKKITTEEKNEYLKTYISHNKYSCQRLKNNFHENNPYYFDDVSKNKAENNIIETCEQLNIKAQIVTDLFFNNQLKGRLYVTQDSPREWTRDELSLMQRVSKKLSFALDRWQIIEKLTIANNNLIKKQRDLKEATNSEQRIANIQAEFVAIASHQFRTPVQIIQGSNTLIERRVGRHSPDLGAELKKFFVRINNACNRMANLVTKTMSLAQFDSGIRLNFTPEVFNIKMFFDNLIEMEINNNKGIEIIVDLEKAPQDLYGDVEMMNHAISNLIENAIKYSPEHSKIFITGITHDNNFELSIKDQGIGIPKEELEKVFTKFFRASNTLNVSGTGVGLYLVQDLIENYHKGKIRVESEENKGSTFFVSIPIRKQED